MSKRFGRQQKRKMRTEIANRQAASALDHALIRHQGGKLEHLRSIFERIERILGRQWIGFDPQQVHVNSIPPVYNVAIMQHLSFSVDHRDPISIERIAQQLEVMQSDTRLDALRMNMHIRLKTPAGIVGYATDLRSLAKLPREDFIKMMTREMANHLWNQPDFQQEVNRYAERA